MHGYSSGVQHPRLPDLRITCAAQSIELDVIRGIHILRARCNSTFLISIKLNDTLFWHPLSDGNRTVSRPPQQLLNSYRLS